MDEDAVVSLGLCKSGVANSFLASATALQVKRAMVYTFGVKLTRTSVVGGNNLFQFTAMATTALGSSLRATLATADKSMKFARQFTQ